MAIVTHVVGDCPGCGEKKSFGNVMIPQGRYLLRGCKKCRFTEEIHLPPVRKKVVYLDQFILSGALRGGDERFVQAVERVTQVCALQLLIAPYSSVHVEEAHQWKDHEPLMRFIKKSARGSEFKNALEVESSQIYNAFFSFLKNESSEYFLKQSDAIQGDINAWDDYLYLNVGKYLGDIDEIRRLKSLAVSLLVETFDVWQDSQTSFQQDHDLELRDAGRPYLQSYLDLVRRLANEDYDALMDAPAISTVVEVMMNQLPEEIPFWDRIGICQRFFDSEHFAQVPTIDLSVKMFATLKSMVKRGAYANRESALRRLSGVFYDIKHISTYAPYCDAFFMDNAMAELVKQPTVALEERYGTKVFSANNLNDFLVWLDELEADIDEEHLSSLKAAYPHLQQR
jgi:hypothetical protein